MEELPQAVWEGSFWIGENEVKCAVLETGERIILEESMENLFSIDIHPDDLNNKKIQEQILEFSKWCKGE